MMKLRALIVDDMPLSRSRTRRYLADQPGLEIVGECGDAETALAEIARTKPDVVLLDVQMPMVSGLEMVERIPASERPAIIFITAFAEFAIDAFAAHAVDYLLKPFDQERLTQSLTRVRTALKLRQLESSPEPAESPYPGRIPVRSGARVTFVQTSTIDWIEAAGNYLTLHCGSDSHFLRETMNQIEGQLDPAIFIRVHRSAIVRVDAVREVLPLPSGDRTLVLHDRSTVTLSRSYRERARAVLGSV